MAFTTQKIEEERFDSLVDLKKYLLTERDRFSLVPISGFVDRGAVFSQDEYYGKGNNCIRFNEDGFRSFCQKFQLPVAFLQNLPEAGLATKALNNHLSREDIRERLERCVFVIDEKKKIVVGVVTESYLGYSNATFLEEIEKVLPNGFDGYDFTVSYWINTRLHLRLLSRDIKAGKVEGKGGTTEDLSRIGIEFRNSLVGDSAVRISYFVYRLVCANGLILQSRRHSGVVHHRGKPETFNSRLKKNLLPVIKSLGSTVKFIEKLMGIPYSPETLVSNGGAKEVYKVLGLSRDEKAQRKKLVGKRINEYDIRIIRAYPERFGGKITKDVFMSRYRDNQSMFDFVNIFTEFAKTQPPRKRLATEEEAGKLANWIMANKRKFL